MTHLLRHYQTQRHLNSFITINESRVLEEAQAVDRARANGQTLGPLAGLPFVVKDQINVAGYPTTSGNIALKDHVPAQNGRIVDIVVNAGAIVLAKANCADLVGQVRPGGTTSANPYFGFVRNPYNPIYSPGGSSGGNGAAIAARGLRPRVLGRMVVVLFASHQPSAVLLVCAHRLLLQKTLKREMIASATPMRGWCYLTV